MADIFISYASEDRGRVRSLAEALQKRRFNVWWDRELAAGQDYAAIIEAQLREAKAVVVVWTASSVASTFVRDEAGRAREDGRLLPVLLDDVEPPMGFGAIQAEDFTSWNGAAGAAQMEILSEALRAKVEGRDVDGVRIARKRRSLMKRVRVVSLLTVVFLLVGIAAGAKYFLHTPAQIVAQQPTDVRAQLLQLLQEGKLTPDQAIALAQLLQPGALGTTPQAATTPAPADQVAAATTTAAEVSEGQFKQAAAATFTSSVAQLLRSPNAQVRQAAVEMGDPTKRDQAIQTLWSYAQAHPEARDAIYQACGAVAAATGNALAPQALEYAAEISPQNPNTWRLLSYAYGHQQRAQDAQAAALVGDGVAAQAAGQTAAAEQNLQQALPHLTDAPTRAFVATQLGAIAASRQDFTSASARYAEAYRATEDIAQTAPDSPASQNLQSTAQNLVTALDRSGRTREACQQLQQAQVDHDVNATDAGFVDRCRTQFRVQLRPAQSQ